MEDIRTLYIFLQTYYRNTTEKKERERLLMTVQNMGISNCPMWRVKKTILEFLGDPDKKLSDDDLIEFMRNPTNLRQLQEKVFYGFERIKRGTSFRDEENGIRDRDGNLY